MKSRSRWSVAAIAQFVVAFVWVYSGVSKIADPGSFHAAVVAHAVLPVWVADLGWLAGSSEIVLGVCVLATGTRAGLCLGMTVVSFGAIAALTWYVLAAPESAIQAAGCGCHARLSDSVADTHTGLVARNAALMGVHLPSLIGAVVGVRKG